MNRLQHTPEGFRDIYRDECLKRNHVLTKLIGIIQSYGYDQIETPTVEFFDIFGTDIGTTPSKELYKFFDRDGNTVVLRPDFTPSVARAASTYFTDVKKPLRLYYQGKTFVNNQSLRGRLRESTQLGGELIGDSSMDADAEVISLVCNIFRSVGINEFKISLTHSDFFKSLINESNLTEEDEIRLRDLISNRNYFGLEEYLEERNLEEDLKNLFLLMGPDYLRKDSTEDAIQLASKYPSIQRDLLYLKELIERLDYYGVSQYVALDLGTISSFRYYTGIIFSGFTFGSGEPLVKGGRYDSLLSNFGKQTPAIGFGFDIDELIQALTRQDIDLMPHRERTVIVYDDKSRIKAISRALGIREGGRICELYCSSDSTDTQLKKEYPDYTIIDLREGN